MNIPVLIVLIQKMYPEEDIGKYDKSFNCKNHDNEEYAITRRFRLSNLV
jgi:hypothetical protein